MNDKYDFDMPIFLDKSLIGLIVFLIAVMALFVFFAFQRPDVSPKEPSAETMCLKGRSYVLFQDGTGGRGLGLVLTRDGHRSRPASCGEGTPADFAEAVERLTRMLDELPLERPESGPEGGAKGAGS